MIASPTFLLRRPRPLAAAALAAVGLLAAAPAAQAKTGRLPDGRWRVQVEGQGPHLFCYFNLVRVGEVRGGKPLLGPDLKYKLTVTQNGHTFNTYQHTGEVSLQVLIDQQIAQTHVQLS